MNVIVVNIMQNYHKRNMFLDRNKTNIGNLSRTRGPQTVISLIFI